MADYISQFTGSEIDQRLAKVPQLETNKQDKLVSGTNIKTVGGTSILGSGDIPIQAGDTNAVKYVSQSLTTSQKTQARTNIAAQEQLVSGTNIKTVGGTSILGSGDIPIQAGDTNAVKYVAQTLTDSQKAQARTNIAAASAAELGQIVTDISGIEADIESLETAVAAINNGDYVTATTLPTASASTMGHIYLIGPDANNNYDRYFTQESGGAYSWVSLGSTQIDLSTYATQAELNQLEAKLNNLAMTRYYGFFPTAGDLPANASELGYAYVGSTAPFAIYEFDGEDWTDTEATINGVQGEPGVGFESVASPTPADGTFLVTLTNGDTITVDMNHDHAAYPKYTECTQAQYDALVTKDSDRLYLIPETSA